MDNLYGVMPAGNYRNKSPKQYNSFELKQRNSTHSHIFGDFNEPVSRKVPKDEHEAFVPKLDMSSPRSMRLANLTEDLDCFSVSRNFTNPKQTGETTENELVFPLNYMLKTDEEKYSKSYTVSEDLFDDYKSDDLSAWNDPCDTARKRRILQDQSQIFGTSPETIKAAYDECVLKLGDKIDYDEFKKQTMRAVNPMYSDLFGRSTPSHITSPMSDSTSFKNAGNKMTNSIEDLVDPCDQLKQFSAHERYLAEFKSHIPFGTSSNETDYDSSKAANADESKDGTTLNRMFPKCSPNTHQNQLMSYLMGSEFYKKAEEVKPWELVHVQVSGLKRNSTEKDLANIVRCAGCHLAKIKLEINPLTHRCMGKAELSLRTNEGDSAIKKFGELLSQESIDFEIKNTESKSIRLCV